MTVNVILVWKPGIERQNYGKVSEKFLVARGWGIEERWIDRAQRTWGQWKYSVYYDGYLLSCIHPNPQNVHHQEWKLWPFRWLWCVSVGPSVVANSGHSLLVRWLGLSTSSARAWVWSLVRERHPTSHMVQPDLKKKKLDEKKITNGLLWWGELIRKGGRSIDLLITLLILLWILKLITFLNVARGKKKTINIIHECTE